MPSKIRIPEKNNNFYLLEKYLDHVHDDISANMFYAIPWQQGVIFTTIRDHECQGCVGCLVRRLISTIYHKKSKISGINSVYCDNDFENYQLYSKWIDYLILENKSSTKCLYFHWGNEIPYEFHVLPVVACNCFKNKKPNLSKHILQKSFQSWPNIVLKKYEHSQSHQSFHIFSASLPNVGPLFCKNIPQELFVSTNPTAASFQDNDTLSARLIGESVERYSCNYIPPDRLFLDQELKKSIDINTFDSIKTNDKLVIWTPVLSNKNEIFAISADRVFSSLHKLKPNLFQPLSSSGVAAGSSFEYAKTNAILEVIERDALLTAWRLIDYPELTPIFHILNIELLQNAHLEWLKMLLVDRKLDLVILGIQNEFKVPQILCLGIPKVGHSGIIKIGSGTGKTWNVALHKAMHEILQGLDQTDNSICRDKPKSFIERPKYWSETSRLEILKKRLFSLKNNSVDFTSNIISDSIIDIFSDKYALYFADMTPPDIEYADWHVARAIVPEFENFVGDSKDEIPNMDRVNKFLKFSKKIIVDHINLEPFPFP